MLVVKGARGPFLCERALLMVLARPIISIDLYIYIYIYVLLTEFRESVGVWLVCGSD